MDTNQIQNEKVLGRFEECKEDFFETFGEWIEREGGWEAWCEKYVIVEEFHPGQPWPVPVPFLETKFGNYTWDPNGQRWLDDDGLDGLIKEYEE